MIKLTETQLAALAEKLERRYPKVSGWCFSYEYPGIFQFSKGTLRLSCTPDWDSVGFICIQVVSDDGKDLDGWDVSYGEDALTPERFVTLVKPYLVKADRLSSTK